MVEAIVAMTTTNTEREAKKLAALFVSEKVAACVQIIPKIQSVYEWEGEIHNDQEYLLLIKTRENLVRKLRRAIEKHHSYEVPEFLVLPVVDSSQDYMEWMCDVTK
ncbi:MAG: divalent-cation tolerance protein CutA [Deltaproteobacteria bacterium]|jgi:periplasmic divalent cation tolerance protein|nr:divalent-cation tolerance protein CutA [Deltaproteobacteria bacterium]